MEKRDDFNYFNETWKFNNNKLSGKELIHLPIVPHIFVSKLVGIGSDNGLSPISAPSHYLNQCWSIVNWTLMNNFNQNTKLFIHDNASEYIVCEMAAILSRGDELNTFFVKLKLVVLVLGQDYILNL